MRKILKNSEVREILRNNPSLDEECVWMDVEFLNSGDGDMLAKDTRLAFALFLMTREVTNAGFNMSCDARSIFIRVDMAMKNKSGYCRSVAISETCGYNAIRPRWLIAELNTGLNHLTVTDKNPYGLS